MAHWNPMKLVLLTLIGVATATSSFANLGDIVDQSIGRFGNPVATSGQWADFSYKDWLIRQWIHPKTNAVGMIIYFKRNGVCNTKELQWFVDRNLGDYPRVLRRLPPEAPPAHATAGSQRGLCDALALRSRRPMPDPN